MFIFGKFFKRSLVLVIILSSLATFYSTNEKEKSLLTRIDEFLKNPEVKAFLDTISYAEGTYNEKGYNTLFAGHIFKNCADHPRVLVGSRPYACVVKNKKQIYSTAAGRYQLLERIWDQIANKLDLKNFEPVNQDRAVVYLIRQNGILRSIINGNFEIAAKNLHKIYPAFPGTKYNQPTKELKELKRFYEKRLKYYKSHN